MFRSGIRRLRDHHRLERANRSRWEALTTVLLIFCAFLLLLPEAMYRDPPGIGTEQSWRLALHLAFDQGLRFGTDFVFTYGPLGFLSVRFPFESTRLLLILSDVFLWANLVAVFLWLAKRLKTLREALALLFAVLCIDGAFYFLQLVIVQFAIFGFWLFHYLRSPNILILMNAAVLSLLMFFIKLNIGLPAVALMILFLVYRSFSPEGRYSALLFLGAYFLTLLALPSVIPVDLLPYIRSSLEIARGYNDAMFLPLVANEHYPLLALVIIGSWVGVLVFHRSEIWREKTAWALLAFVGLFCFILFKQSFVRADDQHMLVFSRFVSLPLGLFYLFCPRSIQRAAGWIFVLAILCSFLGQSLGIDLVERKVRGVGHYLAQIREGSRATGESPFDLRAREKAVFPQALLDQIGERTVDIIPFDISHLYHNGLNYHPRPVMQSYSAYTPFLDELNARKYSSSDAPEFIIFRRGGIDRRYGFFDEAKTKLAILESYRVAAQAGDGLLLRKDKHKKKLDVVAKSEGRAFLGANIPIQRTIDLQHMSLYPEYSCLGTLARIFYQPPALWITFDLPTGPASFRVVKPIIEGGVLINKFVGSVADAKRFFDGDGGLMQDVLGIRLDSPQAWGFEPEFSYRIERMRVTFSSAPTP